MELHQKPPETAGWTSDGYIKNQDCFSAHTYRTIPASENCCGPVAVFNLRRHEGHDVRFPDVLAEMDGLHLLHVPGPTLMYVMRGYLRRHLPGWREVHGRSGALAAAERSRMGVIRYHEQHVPHFVGYYRVDGASFRFLNVCDGQEDVVMPMADFGAGHLRGGSVKLICWE